MTHARIWHQSRPSDHLAAEKPWRYPLLPMEPERGGWLRRIWGARREQKGQRHG